MDALFGVLSYVVPFLVVLTVLVFVHEQGHYWVARLSGVRVEVFSIGFGPELFGFNDRAGTRWKFSALPFGGYVKMFGDADPASVPSNAVYQMTPAERAVSFFHKRLGLRVAIVAAGPAANFLFAIVVLAVLFTLYGQPFTPPQVSVVEPNSAAARAGIEVGDRIVAIDNAAIERFEDVQQAVQLDSGRPLALTVERGGQRLTVAVTPALTELTDRLGIKHTIGRLGISHDGVEYRQEDPATALWQATRESWSLATGTLAAVGQILTGARGTDDLGGPLRIAAWSGEIARSGAISLLWFMAVLSINLGLVNLYPVPMLDGGHLLFFAIEAIRGRPLGPRAQEYGFRIGLALVLSLWVFVTWNDLVHLRVFVFLRDLVS